jgi:hypothetical protein
LAITNVAESPAAVPLVFWLNVGQVNVPVVKFPEVGVPSSGANSVAVVAVIDIGVPAPTVNDIAASAVATLFVTWFRLIDI